MAGRVATVGLEMVFSVVIGAMLGWYLDKKLGTDPYLTMIFTFFGVAAAFKAVLRVARLVNLDDDDSHKGPKES